MRLFVSYLLVLTFVGALLGGVVDIDWREAATIWKNKIIHLTVPNIAPRGEEQSFSTPDEIDMLAVARTVSPSVVAVFGDLPGSTKQVVGSGFFISPAGLVVTSRHVVDHASASYSVVTINGRKHRVTKILKSGTSDVALLRTTASNTPWLTLGLGEAVYPGQSIITVGAGMGRRASLGTVVTTDNVVTAYGSSFTEEVSQWDAVRINAIVRPGDSGGPLLDKEGKVVGVIFAYDAGAQADAFALPMQTVKNLVKYLLEQEYKLSAVFLPFVYDLHFS